MKLVRYFWHASSNNINKHTHLMLTLCISDTNQLSSVSQFDPVVAVTTTSEQQL